MNNEIGVLPPQLALLGRQRFTMYFVPMISFQVHLPDTLQPYALLC